LLIQTLIAVQPQNPALPDLVQQLADSGLRREWASTQDTAFAVLAIGRYLRETTRHQPYDSAQLLQGETLLAAVSAAGQPLSWATTQPSDSQQPYIVKIEGPADATAHVAWLKSGVPLQPPADEQHGIGLRRRYLALDGSDLRGSARSGDLVRIEVTIDAPPGTEGLVIEDLLPAGLEVENQRLETSARDKADEPQSKSDVPGFADDRIDVRDDRVVIVGSMPSGTGRARLTYLARAVTPGVYVLPPVRAEQMYDINVNAISGGGGTFTVTTANGGGVASVRETP
jgi:uncharacterized protein YfaS (alpha-2-macroglobulin family)